MRRQRENGGGIARDLPLRLLPVLPLGLPLLLLLVSLPSGSAFGEFLVDIESGRVSSGYNDVGIPGDTGTRFSLTDDLSTKPDAFFRGRVEYDFGRRHSLSALYAPLTLKAEGVADQPIVFQDESFSSGTKLDATYIFNSYRLTYRYTLRSTDRFELGIGFTAKIRDAVVRVEGGGRGAEKSNVGFVPLAHFRLSWRLSPRFTVLLDGDALAAPQGRAEDIQLAARYQANDRIRIRAGYRVVEGGADNDAVYSFTLVNYLLVGITLSL